MATYGYVRREQPLPTNDQLKIVSDYDCQEIFIEQASYHHLKELKRLLEQLKPDDIVVISSLQVFGQTAKEARRILSSLRSKQVQVISWSTQLHLNYYKRTAGLL